VARGQRRDPQPLYPISSSAEILTRFCRARDGVVRYALEPAYLDLLKKLGNPQKKLPPIIHVAGTNGKGSVCAFLRAMLEAAGYRVHIYTSPHLVRFHERIRIAGELISEDELVEILSDCERLADRGQVSDFEVATAAAFVAFARHKADAVILETGMGGRLDATNVIEKPAASIITRLSFDHCKYLGDSMASIAREKAGIMRADTPCFAAAQPQEEALAVLRTVAAEKNTPLAVGGVDWQVERHANTFRFNDKNRTLDLPLPSLIGPHQLNNAGLAIAALAALPFPVPVAAIAQGLQKAEWPARLQKISQGVLADRFPLSWELWLDGGHNDSAGEVLAAQAEIWRRENPEKLLTLVFGMLSTKDPRAFLAPLAPYVEKLCTVAIPDEALTFSAAELAMQARAAGMEKATPAKNITEALRDLTRPPGMAGRILICGSLYLAGHVLRQNAEGRYQKTD